jgi:hypothetical protein
MAHKFPPPSVVVRLPKDMPMPVVYTDAVTALTRCRTLDEAKYFSDKAEALAAWAKIYNSNQASVEATRLKWHAYRRMGVLAEELMPKADQRGGATALLKEQGFSHSTASVIRRVARLTHGEFKELVDQERPYAPSVVRHYDRQGTDSWITFQDHIGRLRLFCDKHDAKEFANELAPDERKRAKLIMGDIMEWCDQFERHLKA